MQNIIKSQNYQLKRDNFIIYIFLFVAFFLYLMITITITDGTDISEFTGSVFFLSLSVFNPIIIPCMTLMLTSRICGWDYTDKTMNYEILIGHSRKEVYWSRILLSIPWCVIGYYAFVSLFAVVFSLINGWGNSTELKQVIFQYFILLFPLLRMICEFALLTFLLKNCYLAMIIGYLLYELSFGIVMIIEEFTDVNITTLLSSANISEILECCNGKMGYINGEDVMIYDISFESSFVTETIIVSVVAGTICLIAGYFFFRKSDMK